MNPENYAGNKLTPIDAAAPNRSTGPRTEAGKKRSSQNAKRHGLAGRTVVMPDEDMEIYLNYSKEIVEGFNPETPIEFELAQAIADGYWRMRRVRTVEDSMFAWGNYEEAGDFDARTELAHAAFTAARAFRTNSNAFVNLSIYEQRIQRGIDKATKQLREIQLDRKTAQKEALDEAIRLRELDKMLAANEPQPDNPASAPQKYRVHQFVYSTDQIDLEIVRRNHRAAALRAEKAGFNYQEFVKIAA